MNPKINVHATSKKCFSCPFFDKCPQDCRGIIVSGEETFCPKHHPQPESSRLFMRQDLIVHLTTATVN